MIIVFLVKTDGNQRYSGFKSYNDIQYVFFNIVGYVKTYKSINPKKL